MVVIKPDGPRPATQGDFSYDENGFQVFHLSRETPLELRAIYFPEKKGGYGQAQKDRIKYAARQRKHKVKKSWLKAQLTHYGVEFNPKDKMGDLDLVLKSAIEKGQLDALPDSLVNIEKDLREEYEGRKRDYLTSLKPSSSEENEDDDNKSDQLEEHREYLRQNPQGSKDGWNPGHLRGSYIVGFEDVTDNWEIHNNLTLDIWTKKDPPWDMKAAFRFGVLKGTMLLGPNEEPSDENSNSVKGSEDEESETESDFWNEERWEEIGRLQKETQRKESELLDAEKATMEHILKAAFGQYEVNNDEGNEPLTSTQIKERTRILTQQEKVKEAELAAAKDAELRGVVPQSRLFEQQVAQDLDLSGHDIGDPAMDAGGFEETDSEGRNTALGNAVDRQAVNERQTHTTKRKAPEPERPAKRRKIDTENRIWFQWRGRETGEGVIQLPSGNENRGYFDVCVAEATLDGSLSSDLIGRNKKFTAYKVSDEPRSWPEDWESFSEAAYERERNKRWY